MMVHEITSATKPIGRDIIRTVTVTDRAENAAIKMTTVMRMVIAMTIATMIL